MIILSSQEAAALFTVCGKIDYLALHVVLISVVAITIKIMMNMRWRPNSFQVPSLLYC
jgi:hypothetical protein